MMVRGAFLLASLVLLWSTPAHAVKPVALDLSFAPDITMRDINGRSITLSQFKGHMVALHFWASWCGPCRTEIPKMARFIREHPNAAVLPVSLDTNPQAAMRFLDQIGVGIPLMFAPMSVASAYGVRAVPTTIIIDRDMRKLYAVHGEAPWLEKDFSDLLLGFRARLP